MKKIINRITFVLAAVMLLVSCEADYIMFDSSKTFVAFPSKASTVLEPGGQVGIPVYVVALKGSPAITVDFEFDVTDLSNAAIEGEDYTLVNDSKTLSFSNGWGYDTIWIQPIDNNIFEGNKAFNIVLTSNSQNYDFGAISSNVVTIVDDEHPLKAWIGTYTVEALSYGQPGNWDETWSVTTAATEGDLESLTVVINTGSGGGEPFLAGIDADEMTITIAAGTEVGEVYGYGPTAVYVGDYATIDTEAAVVGTIEEDGTIKIDNLTMILTDYGFSGGLWDAFNTTWTKTGKKTTSVGDGYDSKVARFK
jgi:Calx-beta domain-containing protein